MSDEYIYLTEKEFMELEDKSKWNYIESFKKMLIQYKNMAETNCSECEHKLITVSDINIGMFFEDWRGCSENCDECGEEEKTEMCQIQFELMNHLANSLISLEKKFNMITKIMLTKDKEPSDFLKEFEEYNKENELRSKEMFG